MKYKALIAFSSFLLGALSVLIIGNRRLLSTVHARQVPDMNEISATFRPIVPSIGVAVPQVIPLQRIKADNNLIIDGTRSGPMIVGLDGLESTNNLYSSPAGVKFIYGGGAYVLRNATVGGQLELEFTGAAANTVHLLQSLKMLPGASSGQATEILRAPAPPEPAKNIPISRRTKLVRPLHGDISSQYDGTKQ